MKKLLLLLCFLINMTPELLLAEVTARDTVITWHTFDYSLNPDYTLATWTDTPYDTVTKTFAGIILENEYLKVILVPEFGGRILSMIYKPTGHEELYRNPVGAPYGIGEEWFYYKWLMVYGGIFPTFPEPEHGKGWLVPWNYEYIELTPDTVSIRMSWQDTIAIEGINTGKWKYGKTNLICDYTVTLVSGRSALETDCILYNDSADDLDYEYWTCLTLAPGSDPGNPGCTGGAELIIPASKIKIPSWYPQIAALESRIPGQYGLYSFDVLREYKNWIADGIIYPWDDMNLNYWGVINHDNGEGIIRVADNTITPGIKIWVWSYAQSQSIDPWQEPHNSRRPYIELWAGHSNEFFEPAHIAANSMIRWKAVYIPTVGLSGVTNANENIIADFSIQETTTENLAHLDFVSAYPANDVQIVLEITGQHPQQIGMQTLTPDPLNGNQVIAVLPAHQTWDTQDSVKCTITGTDDHIYLATSLSLEGISTGITDRGVAVMKDFQLFQNYPNPFNSSTLIKYAVGRQADVLITIYNILGHKITTLVDRQHDTGNYQIKWTPDIPNGIYYCKFEVNSQNHRFTDYKKLILLK